MTARDHDWEIVASRDPFFGVVGADEFRMSRLDDAARERFFASGRDDIQRVLGYFDADVGSRPTGGRALDFGSGVGRLARAIAKVADTVVGYDIAPSMVALARQSAPANASFTTDFPVGPFDWINSYIVFQHIPPAEGLGMLDRCLAAAAPLAFLSVQFTGWRDGKLPSRSLPSRAAQWLERQAHRRPSASADPLIRMYDYDFSEIMRLLSRHGFGRVALRHTQHTQHHGAWFISRRG
jgi:SAM-dependent methyltransferase